MTKTEWLSLPPALALATLYDLAPALQKVPAPRVPFAPKYDAKVSRKAGQYCFASEMLRADLEYWHGKKTESAKSGGQYAAKDAKQAEELARWIAWRSAFPSECWRGKRGKRVVTAAPPSRDPDLYSWERRGGGENHPPREQTEYPDADYGGSGDDDIPF